MQLDKLWLWEKKRLPCRIRHESGNPAGDDLRERFAELAGVNLHDLLNEMKNDKKRREAKNKSSTDYEADKRYKEVLSRSHVLGATSIALEKINKVEAVDKSSEAYATSKANIKKRFLPIPQSPPKRILMDIQRERSKPLIIPDHEEKNTATVKLEKKLAKQRAQRMAAKDEAAKEEEAQKLAHDSQQNIRSLMRTVLPTYGGDKFGTAGDYMEGLLYLSRMPPAPKKNQNIIPASHHVNLLRSKSIGAPLTEQSGQHSIISSDGDSESFSAQKLFQSVSEDELNAKLYCATSLCNWARNPSNAARLASEGAVRAILLLSNEKVPKLSVFCAGAFRYMSEHSILAEKIIEEKSLNTISEMIASTNDDFICGNLAICLLNLTLVPNKEGQLVEDSIVLCLMNLIGQKADLHSVCCRGLYNLTCVDSSYPMMERVIRALVSLSTTSNANVKNMCAAALCNLADLRSIRLRMVEEGVISVLGALSRGTDTRTRRVCAVILQNLTATRVCRTEMVSRNCVQVAFGLSSDQDPIILRCMGLALSRLALESSNSSRIISDGGVMALCNIAVKYPTILGISQPAAVAFQLLSSRAACRVSLVAEGSVTAIASLLRLSQDIFTLQHGLLALCNLLSEKQNHLPIVQQGLITTLTVLSTHQSDLLKDFCALAYFNLCCVDDSRKHFINAGAMHSLIGLSKHESIITKRRCAATFCNLASYEIGISRMVNEGIISALVTLLETSDIMTMMYSCATLCRLCSTVENGKLILESGAVASMVRGATEGDDITRIYCCAVLSSLSFYESCREFLCDHGIITALHHLSEMSDQTTRQRCLVAYANLSCEENVQNLMVEHGVVKIIAKLADSYQEVNQMCCAKALCNMSCLSANRMKVVNGGGVDALMMISLVRSVDIQTKLLCANALCNLFDATTCEHLIQIGIVAAIANLCSLKDLEVNDSCSLLFNQLSSYKSGRQKIVEKNVGLRALLDMFDAASVSSKIIIARTVANLVLCTVVRADTIKHGGLVIIGKGAKLSDLSASTHCIMALLSACTVQSFRSQIVMSTPIVSSDQGAISDLPKILCAVAFESSDTTKLLYCVKALCMLAWSKESRAVLQNPVIASSIIRLVEKNPEGEALVWISQIFLYICYNYRDHAELMELGVQSTLRILCASNDPRIVKCAVSILRCFCSDKYCVNILANTDSINLITTVLHVGSIDKSTAYNIADILLHFASHSVDARSHVLHHTLISIFSEVANFSEVSNSFIVIFIFICTHIVFLLLQSIEVLAAVICLFSNDTKFRNNLANEEICNLLTKLMEANKSERVLINLVHAMYSLSKLPSTREQLLNSGCERILLKLSQTDSLKLKTICSKCLKNLSSDSSETIEEGAVAALIAMSLEVGSDDAQAYIPKIFF